jgi:hypothetical protein
LAAWLNHVRNTTHIGRLTAYTVFALLILLNLFQCTQAKYNIIHYDSMAARTYFGVFGTVTKQADQEMYLDHPDFGKALRGETEE